MGHATGHCLLCCCWTVVVLLLDGGIRGTPLETLEEHRLGASQIYPEIPQNTRTPEQLCPGIPTETSELNECHQVTSFCTTDVDCSDTNQICCFNGCIYTCQPSISPPQAVDWLEEPAINSIENNNQSSQENEGFVSCSTTVRRLPSHVHSCPEGFRCNVFEAGDPISGAPNKGMCVAEPSPVSDSFEDVSLDGHLHAAGAKETVFLPGGCLLTNSQYDDLEGFLKGGHYSSCQCQQGSVQCKVSYNSTLVIDLPNSTSLPSSFIIVEDLPLEEDVTLPEN